MLGSGLGGLADAVENPVSIPFDEMPGWPEATAPGHVGRLLLGRLAGVQVVMLQGRFHLYEGNDPGLVVQPVLLFRQLGARIVVLTNAAGGVNPDYGPGTLMVIADHLNLTGRTPLLGRNADGLGQRFPDLTDVWTPALRQRLHAAAAAEGVELAEGVYAGLLGPSYETPAEVRMLRTLGADAVGMSTVLEADRGALGRARRVRRLAGHEPGRGLQRAAADATRRCWRPARRRARAWPGSCSDSSRSCPDPGRPAWPASALERAAAIAAGDPYSARRAARSSRKPSRNTPRKMPMNSRPSRS